MWYEEQKGAVGEQQFAGKNTVVDKKKNILEITVYVEKNNNMLGRTALFWREH